MDRRDFLKTGAVAAVGLSLGLEGKAQTVRTDDAQASGTGRLIISAPMLQNYAETSVGVAFAVSDMANGFVTYGRKKDLSDGVTVKCGGYRVTDMNDKVMLVRLTGLRPSTKYYYKIGADRINYVHGHKMINLGTENDDTLYSFKTAGAKTASHFVVINDTHSKMDTFDALTRRIDEIDPPCVVWDGDCCSCAEDIDTQVRVYLTPDISIKDYASGRPYLICPGNHENRGLANRHLEKVWMFRQSEERSPRDWDLGRNFAIRLGDIALIGLDTGEDKVDCNPIFCGLFNSEPYRVAQKAWLEDALGRPDIADAPFLVACCHIPLYDSRPDQNPGDVYPADYDPKYLTDYAHWQRSCMRLWGPLLTQAGCQLVISGHQHSFNYEPAGGDRSWAQIVGGGPHISGDSTQRQFPTLTDVRVKGGKLKAVVYDMLHDIKLASYTYTSKK